MDWLMYFVEPKLQSFPAAMLSQWVCLHCQYGCHPSSHTTLQIQLQEVQHFCRSVSRGFAHSTAAV